MWANIAGLLFAISAVVLVRFVFRGITNVQVAFLWIACLAVPIIFAEIFILKYHRKASFSLDFSKKFNINIERTMIKLLGFYATAAVVALFYWMFPEYKNQFYHRYFYLIKQALAFILIGAIPYIALVDNYMKNPKDSYWHLGMFLTGKTKYLDKTLFKNHFLGWLVKAFFLPLMLTFFFDKVPYYRNINVGHVFNSAKDFYDFFFTTFYAVDLLYAATGYLLTFRIFDSHIRSAEPTFLGWFVALECYRPFWGFSSSKYLAYGSNREWGSFFWDYPIIYTIWAVMILAGIFVYVWATTAFGIRFSNLTHRGILTNGPFRYTKHPAYVSKNVSWWLISMPFLFSADFADGLRRSLLLGGVTLIYIIRARTEEAHLSRDPVYVEYSNYINEHGIFAKMKRFWKNL